MTIRARLFATITAAVLLSTVLTVAVSETLLQHRAQAQALRTLASDAAIEAASPIRTASDSARPRAARRALQRAGPLGSVFAVQAAGSLTSLRPLQSRAAEALLRAIPSSPSASGQVRIGGRELLYAARSGRLGRVVLVRTPRLGGADAPSFAISIVVVGLLGSLLSALLAWLLARRLTRPLRDLARASAELPGRQDSAKIARPAGAPREVVALVDTFNDMADELAAMRSAQRDFVLAASHELKAPITAVAAYAEGIQDEAVEPLEGARVILAEAGRLERLVRDLLDLARLDRGEFDVNLERLELGSLAQALSDRHAGRASELGVRLEVQEAEPGCLVWADRGRLTQAASNLIENAIRVSPRGAAVEVGIGASSISICDHGPGLAQDDLEHAFERFYLHRRHRDALHDGSGLGLAIVSELLSAMGGSASAEIREGGGMRFVLNLREADSQLLAGSPA